MPLTYQNSGTCGDPVWKKIFSHDVSGGAFADEEAVALSSPYEENALLYSALDKLEQYRVSNDDKFEFKLCYPDLASSNPFPCNVWRQSTNPLKSNKRDVAAGYQEVNVTFTTYFGGLSKRKAPYSDTSVISNRPSHEDWYHPVGALVLLDNGKINGPECDSKPDCPSVSKIELFVKKPLATAGSGRKKREVFDLVEEKVRRVQKREVEEETEEEVAMRSFGSRLRYECGLARRFLDPESEVHYDERWLQCNWNNSWTQTDSLDPCVWVACLYPPHPPEGLGVKLDWDGDPVEFNANVSYVCESDDLFFEWDRDLPEFNISCLEGGIWDEPKEWPICLECKSL